MGTKRRKKAVEEQELKEDAEEEKKDNKSESDSEYSISQFRVEPILPKQPSGPRKRSKKNVSAVSADDAVVSEEPEVTEEKPSRSGKERIWTDEDEICILQSIIDYTNQGHGDPYSNTSAFLAFVENSLSFKPNQKQLRYKMRKLQKKFDNKVNKVKKFSLKSYQLFQQIWGNNTNTNTNTNPADADAEEENNAATDALEANPNHEKADEGIHTNTKTVASPNLFDEGNKLLSSCFEWGLTSEPSMFLGLDVKGLVKLLGTSKVNELEKKWKKIYLAEMELHMQKLELVKEQGKLIVDALNLSRSSPNV